MSVCVAGVALLQLYYSYTNYISAQSVFKRDTEKAFDEAVDSAFVVRNENIVRDFRSWLLDTTYVEISCRWDESQDLTQFTIKELQPISTTGQNEISMNVEELDERADSITPEIKEKFVTTMEEVVRNGLKKNIVWFFTQGIGQRLTKAHSGTPIDIEIIEEQYRLALSRKGINLPFVLTERGNNESDFCTGMYNIGVKNPEERQLQACFNNTELYLLKQLKWVIISSALLIFITLFCFWYTAKVLLSQQKLSELKDDFISNMTHEIHSPLTSVIITAEALKEFDMGKEERDNYIDIILHQAVKLASLTDDILSGVKIDRKGINLEDAIKLNSVIEEVKLDYKDKAIIQYVSSDIVFKGNKKHITAAISNLIENAIKYNTYNNTVVTIDGSIKGKEIIIKVADNGPGIPDEHKQKVFDEFYRIPTGNVHNVKGYGLGLSYVKKVINAHNGSVLVQDNFPNGSVFIIRIPNEV